MGIFANILDKLGIGHGKADPKPDIRPLPPKRTDLPAGGAAGAPPARTPTASPAPTPMSEVDVEARLEKLAADNPQKLNWRTSIVVLMKLLGMDSSLSERKELAKELGAPAELMEDSASMNLWLHKEVLRRVAANGGKVPANLLD